MRVVYKRVYLSNWRSFYVVFQNSFTLLYSWLLHPIVLIVSVIKSRFWIKSKNWVKIWWSDSKKRGYGQISALALFMGEKNMCQFMTTLQREASAAGRESSSFLILQTDRFSPPTLHVFFIVAHALQRLEWR